MELVITLNMDDAAFDAQRDSELKRIFLEIRAELDLGEDGGPCFDSNGNRVGKWTIEGECK